MKTNNIERLIFHIVIFLLFSSVHANGQTQLPKSKHYTLERLADGVYAAVHNDDGGYSICNAGIIDLGDRTIVIDPFISPIAARDLEKHAEFLTGKPVSIVLNLDPHSDHTGGNQVFFPSANIIGTPNARKYIEDHFDEEFEYNKKTTPEELKQIQNQLKVASEKEKVELKLFEAQSRALIESFPELRMTPPDITIRDTMVIYGPKRKIIVIPTGTGHTTGDMVVYLPEEKIIFMSDQLFVERHPYLGDGDPESLIRNLKTILELKPVIAVPGHGPVGNTNSIHAMIDYIETLTGMVRKEILKGTDEKKIQELPMPEKYKNWLISIFYKINLNFLYKKLTNATNSGL